MIFMKEKPCRMMKRDTIHVLENGSTYVLSENYFYKTEAYYNIVLGENEGKDVVPHSEEILEANIVPLTLEKARLAGIPVCDWEISYSYVNLPSIVYGINYYSDSSNYSIVQDQQTARRVIKQVTHSGKYPFCYQKLEDPTAVEEHVCVLGKIANASPELESFAAKVYEAFRIPLVNIVAVAADGGYRLSSLGPMRYSQLSKEERDMLESMLRGI
jgi:hypothetical protein